MSKHSFRSLFKSFTLIAFITFLNSCEGFFTNNDVDDKIRAAIDYANTPFSTFVVSADSNAGTIIPSGQVQYKPTDLQNIEFTCNTTYEFIGWDFSYKQTAQAADTPTLTAVDKEWWKDFITIIKTTESEPNKDGKIVYTLQIRFDKAVENLLISPICGKKPKVKKMTPDTITSGVSRDTEVSIIFDSPIDPESLKDSIKIKVDGADYTSFFTTPVIANLSDASQQETRIIFSPKNKLPCENGKTAVVSIELSDKIKSKEGISFSAQTLSYIINSSVSTKAVVNLSDYNASWGRTMPDGANYVFDTSTQKTLTFAENQGYQFLHWDVNNSDITIGDGNIDDLYLNPTTFYTNKEIKETDAAKIKPFCVERPVFKPTESIGADSITQPRDADIILTFDIPDGKVIKIPDEADFIIECTGRGTVTSSFYAPTVQLGNQIHINARPDSRIIVNEGEVPTITVIIPDSVYYEYEDSVNGITKNVKVTLGKQSNGKAFSTSYKISNTTKQFANVSFNSEYNGNTTGTIIYTQREGNKYFIGDKISLDFTLEDANEYQFLCWTSSNPDVVIERPRSMQTYATVNGNGTTVISAICVPRLSASITPVNAYDSNDNVIPVPKDSDIVITFNAPPYDGIEDKITISCNGVSIKDCFNVDEAEISPDGKTLTIRANLNNKIDVPEGTTKTVKLCIPSDSYYYYYLNGTDYPVTCASDLEFEYVIDESTAKKAKVTFIVCASDDTVLFNAGTINYDGHDVSLNSQIICNVDSQPKAVQFAPTDDFMLGTWQVTNTNTNSIVFDNSNYPPKLTIKDEDENIVVKVIANQRYRVSSFTPDNISGSVSCDSPVVLEFNRDISSRFDDSNPLDGISIKTDIFSLTSCFEDPVYDSTTNKITIKSKYDGSFDDYFNSSYIPVTITVGLPLVNIPQTYTYYINKEKENNPPVLENFTVKKSFDTAASDVCLLQTFSSYATGSSAEQNIKRNWVNKLFFSGTVSDDEAGLKSITIKEKLIRTPNGIEIANGDQFTTTVNLSGKTQNLNTIFNSNYQNSFYSFKSIQDGVVEIEVIFTDNYGNTVSQSFEVIKDTVLTAVPLMGAGQIKNSNTSDAYFSDAGIKIEDTETRNYKNIIYSQKASELIIKSMDGISYYKGNHSLDDSPTRKTIGSMQINKFYVKTGFSGNYTTPTNSNNITDNLSTFISGDEDYYTNEKTIKYYFNGSYISITKQSILFLEPSFDEDRYVKYTSTDDLENTIDNIIKVSHVVPVVFVANNVITNNPKRVRIYINEEASPETPIRYIYLDNSNNIKKVTNSADWYESGYDISPNDDLNINNVEGASFGTVSKYNYLIRTKDFYVFHNIPTDGITVVDNTNWSEYFQDDVPEYSYELVPGPVNSNYYNVSIHFSDTTNNRDTLSTKGYSYFILLKYANSTQFQRFDIPQEQGAAYGGGYLQPLKDFSFRVISGRNYTLSLQITDYTTFRYTQATKEINCSSIDRIPPEVSSNINYHNYFGGYFVGIVSAPIKEDNPLMYDGKPYYYYNYSSEEMSEATFDSMSSNRMAFYPYSNGVGKMYCPYYYTAEKYLNIKVFDAFGNYTYKSIYLNEGLIYYRENIISFGGIEIVPIYELDEEDEPILTSYQNNVSFNYTIQNTEETFGNRYVYSYYFDKDLGYWKKDYESTLQDKSANEPTSAIISSLDKFYKVLIKERGKEQGKEGWFYYAAPLYFYPKYYTDNLICSVKNFFEINGIVTLSSDQPAYIHTVFSPYNYGSDIERWEALGGSVNEQVIDASSISYSSDSITINEGEYYVVIAHFADGTSAIGKVHQK